VSQLGRKRESTRRGALGCVSRVRVGSQKAPKIEAVRSALEAFTTGVDVQGVAVESGVPEQPVGLDEIAAGARNRARRALDAPGEPCDLAFGIEDGLVEVALGGRAEVFNIGCAFVTDGQRESLGLSSGFAYPPDCTAPALEQRADIGTVFDRLWREYDVEASASEEPSGAGAGNIGKLTFGVLPRSEYGRHAVVCALVRFLHPSLYFDVESSGQRGSA
jgi:inosine/xanthosine triphosphatase